MLPLGRSLKLSAQLDQITKDMDRLDRELNAEEMRKRVVEEFDQQVRKYVRRFVTQKEEEDLVARPSGSADQIGRISAESAMGEK